MNSFFRSAAKPVFAIAVIFASALPATAQDALYIPLGSAGEVAIVDTGQDAVVGTIPGLPAVHGLAATPDGRLLIAGSYEEREAGGGPSPRPSGVSEDEHADHHARPSADAGSGSFVSTLSVVRTDDGSIMRRIDVPGAVHHVAIDPDGRLAAVTHPNQDAVSLIDLRSFAVVATIATGPLPNYAVFSQDGGSIYVSNAGNDTVSEVDSERRIVLRNIVVGKSPEHVVLSPDGRTLYVNNVEDGAVSVVSLDEGEVTESIPIGAVPHGIDLSDDGGTLFVSAMGDDELVAVDLTGGGGQSVVLAPAPYHLAALRGSGKLYVSSAENPTIWVLDQRDLTTLGEIAIGGKGHQMVQAAGG